MLLFSTGALEIHMTSCFYSILVGIFVASALASFCVANRPLGRGQDVAVREARLFTVQADVHIYAREHRGL